MKSTILQKLKSLEHEENITILYACESGSRAWDFASPDSDWDCRFIYKRPLSAYVTLSPVRDVIDEIPIEDKLDINGWDIHKALKLAGKSNPALMEWLFSPIVYVENAPKNGSFTAELRTYVQEHYSPKAIAYHYHHMAQSNYHKYLEGKKEVQRKKYLYVLRPLFCIEWLREHNAMPPTRFLDVFGGIQKSTAMEQAIHHLLREKMAKKETEKGPRESVLDGYIHVSLEHLEKRLEMFPVREADYERLNGMLKKELL